MKALRLLCLIFLMSNDKDDLHLALEVPSPNMYVVNCLQVFMKVNRLFILLKFNRENSPLIEEMPTATAVVSRLNKRESESNRTQ